jgi:hypothetical protein
MQIVSNVIHVVIVAISDDNKTLQLNNEYSLHYMNQIVLEKIVSLLMNRL